VIAALAVLLAMQDPASAVPVQSEGQRDVRVTLAFPTAATLRFNRAEGVSLGGAASLHLSPRSRLAGTLRYGFADERAQGSLSVSRVAVTSTTALGVFSEFRDTDPLASGLRLDNTGAALLLGHDDGAYAFRTGAELVHQRSIRGAQAVLQVEVADESGPRVQASSRVNDALGGSGILTGQLPVAAGTFVRVHLNLQRGVADAHVFGGMEARGGDGAHARLWFGAVRRLEIGAGLDVAVAGWAGVGGGDSLPQSAFRLGGVRSLRGYPAGAITGERAWTASADLGAAHRVISPVVFMDVGGAAGAHAGAEASGASAGVGLSVLRGIFRIHAAHPLRSGYSWRLDFLLHARR